MQATCTEKTLQERTNLLDSKLAIMSHGRVKESSFGGAAEYVLQYLSLEESSDDSKASTPPRAKSERIFHSHNRMNLQFEETEGKYKYIGKLCIFFLSFLFVVLCFFFFIIISFMLFCLYVDHSLTSIA